MVLLNEAVLIYVCRFRRQHEQLRAVIARVLRPAVTPQVPASPAGTPDDPQGGIINELLMDAADANAIEVTNSFVVTFCKRKNAAFKFAKIPTKVVKVSL